MKCTAAVSDTLFMSKSCEAASERSRGCANASRPFKEIGALKPGPSDEGRLVLCKFLKTDKDIILSCRDPPGVDDDDDGAVKWGQRVVMRGTALIQSSDLAKKISSLCAKGEVCGYDTMDGLGA